MICVFCVVNKLSNQTIDFIITYSYFNRNISIKNNLTLKVIILFILLKEE